MRTLTLTVNEQTKEGNSLLSFLKSLDFLFLNYIAKQIVILLPVNNETCRRYRPLKERYLYDWGYNSKLDLEIACKSV